MRVFVIRHGFSEHNRLGKFNGQLVDDSLTPEGIEQTQEIIPLLPKGIEKIYTSDLKRAYQTAEIISGQLKTPILVSKDLREVHAGDFNGLSFVEMNAKAGREVSVEYRAQKYDFHPWGGESVEDVQTRIKRCMEDIKAKEAGNTVLIIGHGGIIRAMYYLYKKELVEGLQNLSIHEFEV